MKNTAYNYKALLLAGALFLFNGGAQSQTSYEATGAKTPKHYFNTVITLDAYRKPEKNLKDTQDYISRRLKTYGVRQFDLSFCTPLITIDDNSDTTVIKNSHILLTGNYTVLRPAFSGISDHKLVKLGVGIRYIFNTGKKGVWFIDAAPFVTKDVSFDSKGYFRLASTLIYSHNVSDRFNVRLGVTKSFLWGNRFYWPFIGVRFGRLDKTNFSIQFPRYISLNVPVSSRFLFSVYSRAQGGMYNFSNHDSLYFRKQDATFSFTRYEINTGFRFDFRFGKNFGLYIALGASTRNNITFYSERANKNRPRQPYRTYFYSEKANPSLYLNLGCVIKFGKTKSYFNNKNIYDAINLNSTMDENGNAQIPLTPKKRRSDNNLESLKDLMDYNDF